jgi:phospholipid/cholesterol/gamma-HCH transport system ATP-binding protein
MLALTVLPRRDAIELPPASPRTSPTGTSEHPSLGVPPAVQFDRVSFAFDDNVVLHDVSLTVAHGEMVMLLGASGSGKSVLLRLILGLLRPDSGHILVNGIRIDDLDEPALMAVRADVGMMFQENALFDSLTVDENVGYRLTEELRLPRQQVRDRVREILTFVGLQEYGDRLPSELSGGQRRRVAVARAMAARPGLLLLDDPTSGLDPITATSVDDEIVKLRDLESVTCVLATHQIRDAFYIATRRAVIVDGRPRVQAAETLDTQARFLVLHDGRLQFEGTASQLEGARDPYLRQFMFRTRPPW